MEFWVYCPAVGAVAFHVEVDASPQDPIRHLKRLLCAELQVDPAAMVFWDYWNNSQHSLLEQTLDQTLGEADVREGQPLLLETKNMQFCVHCTVVESEPRDIAIIATETLMALKVKAAEAFDLSPGSFALWDYYRCDKYKRLEPVLQQTVAAANLIDDQDLLLEATVLKLIVLCPFTESGSRTIWISSSEKVRELKAQACAAFSVGAPSAAMWDYYDQSKHFNLDTVMHKTLAEAQLVDGQEILLEARGVKLYVQYKGVDGTISGTKCIQVRTSDTVGKLRALVCSLYLVYSDSVNVWDYRDGQKLQCLDDKLDLTLAELSLTGNAHWLLEAQQLQPVQPSYQESHLSQASTSAREEQLLHALLEYLSTPADNSPDGSSSSSSCTAEQLTELLEQTLQQLKSRPCQSSSTVASDNIPSQHDQMATSSVAADELQQLRNCVVCLDAPRSVLLLPCKHLVLCEDCSQHLKAQPRRPSAEGSSSSISAQLYTPCPVCRVPSYQHMKGVILS